MTESEWLACTEPEKMLEFLKAKASERKLRLFACACCRRIWHLLRVGESRRVVEMGEQYADEGQSLPDELRQYFIYVPPDHRHPSRQAVWWASRDIIEIHTAVNVGMAAASAVARHDGHVQRATSPIAIAARKVEFAAQAALVRCIIGNPFRPVALDPAWLTWHDGLVRQLAQVAYEERQLPSGQLEPDRLAVLADALEEAGIEDQEILGHLRGPGPHTRGCHIVDLLLGRE
jgi:hypothetical protein